MSICLQNNFNYPVSLVCLLHEMTLIDEGTYKTYILHNSECVIISQKSTLNTRRDKIVKYIYIYNFSRLE